MEADGLERNQDGRGVKFFDLRERPGDLDPIDLAERSSTLPEDVDPRHIEEHASLDGLTAIKTWNESSGADL